MKKINSKIIPLFRKDIDTDLIIPAEFLTVTDKIGLGKHLFARLREMEKDFPFNLAKYEGAEILVAGDNFGCGSSREHAAWALADWGIKVIIAPSFSDIFLSNAMKNGILPVILFEEDVAKIAKEEAIEVDLINQTVAGKYQFEIDPYRKDCLINGMDDMAYLLKNISAIEGFDKKHANHLFFDTSKI